MPCWVGAPESYCIINRSVKLKLVSLVYVHVFWNSNNLPAIQSRINGKLICVFFPKQRFLLRNINIFLIYSTCKLNLGHCFNFFDLDWQKPLVYFTTPEKQFKCAEYWLFTTLGAPFSRKLIRFSIAGKMFSQIFCRKLKQSQKDIPESRFKFCSPQRLSPLCSVLLFFFFSRLRSVTFGRSVSLNLIVSGAYALWIS